MLAELIDVSGWSHEQWLAASILAFIGVTVLVVAHRMYKLFAMTHRPRYRPNLRPLRRSRAFRAYLEQQQKEQDSEQKGEDDAAP